MLFYKYIFTCFFNYYQFEKDFTGRAYFVSFLLSFLESINLTSIIIIILSSYRIFIDSKLLGFLLFVTLSVVNLIVFVKDKKYNKIIEEANSRCSINRNNIKVLLILYYITSALLLSVAALLEATRGSMKIIYQYLGL